MLLFTFIGVGIVLVVSFFLFILPGIYMIVILTFVPIVRLCEKGSFFSAISRARQLISGSWWSTLGLLLVLYIIQTVFSFIFQLPSSILTFFVIFTGAMEGGGDVSNMNSMSQFPILTAILAIIAALGYFAYAITVVGITFQFFSLVEKKEAASLVDRVESLGQDEAE